MTIQAEPSAKGTQETVTSMHRWTGALFSFRCTRPAGFAFVPGQFARVGMQVGNEMQWRAYSITSAPGDDTLEFVVIAIPDGLLTGALVRLAPGDTVWIEKLAYGFLTADRFADGADLWMLATGTGLGPFVSILQDGEVWQRFRNLILVHGVRHANELAYQDSLRALQGSAAAAGLPARLQLVQAVTRDETLAGEPGGTGGAAGAVIRTRGRIPALLADGALEGLTGCTIDVAGSRFMICGNPDMITETRAWLDARGFRPCRRAQPGQFITEDYW